MRAAELAVVCGSAAELHDDVATLQAPGAVRAVWIAVNDAGWVLAGIPFAHWCTLHPDLLQGWQRKRAERGGEPVGSTWGPSTRRRYDGVGNYRGHWGAGSSALFAVKIALEDVGCARVVLCGVPLHSGPYAQPDAGTWQGDWPAREAAIHREGWTRRADQLGARVRSMSGWTRELLGAPTPAFIRGEEELCRSLP